ncbi:MAG: hypothetical protein FJ130_01910 [Deltaproteobacteria bacterium]|nr:hypothetical protein [Deltaproteobacteria bacterium]
MPKSIYSLIHRHGRFAVIGLSLVLFLLTFGCASLRYAGAPPPSYDVDEDLKQLAEHFKPATAVKNYYAKSEPTPKDRDVVISARLVMINLEYLKWLRTVTADKQFLDTATDVLILSLNLAAAATGGETAKTVLSAISAGVAGSKTSIDKHYYYEKTVPALVAAMNAQRKDVLARILEGMKKNLEEYSFEQALADVYEYYQAGTFMGAITAIQSDSGAKEKKADLKIESLTIVTPVPAELQARREKAAEYVKKLKPDDLKLLAKSLGILSDDPLPDLLERISKAQSTDAFNAIAQKIKILFGKEF